MDKSANITATVFTAYLKCPTKAYLIAHGEQPPDTFFADARGRISAAYKVRANQSLRTGSTEAVSIDFLRVVADHTCDVATLFVDCETASYSSDQVASARAGRRARRPEPDHDYVPILYSAWDKSDQSDDLLVCFGALAIRQATGTEIPTTGKVIYGEAQRGENVRDCQLPPENTTGRRGNRIGMPCL
jgi:hypothetical protein